MRPIVFVPGLFGSCVPGQLLQNLQNKFPSCRVLAVNPGPVSSLHDRAVECFYEIKGGRTGTCCCALASFPGLSISLLSVFFFPPFLTQSFFL